MYLLDCMDFLDQPQAHGEFLQTLHSGSFPSRSYNAKNAG
jgi:hypothetical protein